jgi:hypothetical protein
MATQAVSANSFSIVQRDNKKIYRVQDKENGTRSVYVDRNNDGKIDGASYFLDDKDGKCLYSKHDFDFDGKYDEINRFTYWDDGALQSVEVDEDGDGQFDRLDMIGNDGEVILSTKNYTIDGPTLFPSLEDNE